MKSYNLKDRTKLQFISINGFKTATAKQIWKHWKIYRRRFISKARIHATDKRFEPLREKSIDLIYFSPDTFFITAFQTIREIPVNKTNFYYPHILDVFVIIELNKRILDSYMSHTMFDIGSLPGEI